MPCGTGDVCAFDVAGSATCNLTLADNSVNTLKSGERMAGLQVQNKGGSNATLTITADSQGSLSVYGGGGAAGIGGGNSSSGGTINIAGGTIEATGGDYGAGIGDGDYPGGEGDGISGQGSAAITISGGNVTATCANGQGAGIGYGGDTGAAGGSFSTGESGHAVIIASSIKTENKNEENWGGVFFINYNDGVVYGSHTLTGSLGGHWRGKLGL